MAAIVLAAAMVTGLVGCSSQSRPADAGQSGNSAETARTKAAGGESEKGEQAASLTYANTIPWDVTYDMVVVGFGGADAVASTVASDEGASVLMLEKAFKGHEGGNTRYCSQRFMYTEDVEEMKTYLKEVSGLYTNMDDEIVDYLAGGVTTPDWYKSIGGSRSQGRGGIEISGSGMLRQRSENLHRQ